MAGALERLRQKDKEARIAENPEEQEIKGPTIKAILADNVQGELFGEYLAGEGEEGKKLGIKLKSGDASQLGREEFIELEKRRKDFLSILEVSKSVVEVLNPATLKEIIESSSDPYIKSLAGVAGPEAMRDAIINYLPRIAITDRKNFAALSDRALTLKETRKVMEEKSKAIKKFCKEHDIDETKYVNALHSGDFDEVISLVREDMGFVRKLWKTPKRLRKEFDKSNEMRDQIENLEADLRGVGLVLEMSLMDNKVIHEAFVADLTKESEIPKFEGGMPFSEVKKLTDKDLEGAKEEFRKGLESRNLDPDGISNEQYEQEVGKFSQSYMSKAKKGKKGFWATIWETLSAPQLAESLKR